MPVSSKSLRALACLSAPLAVAALGAALAPTAADAANFTVLYTFSGPDGANPNGGLFVDGSGAVYGTTYAGGFVAPPCNVPGAIQGCGTIFKLTPPAAGQTAYTISNYVFSGPDGAQPLGGVAVNAAGAIFTTTYSGGAATAGSPAGAGTVVLLTPRDATRTAYDVGAFSVADLGVGAAPFGRVAIDAAGALYFSTTGEANGSQDNGRVVKVVPATQGTTGSIGEYTFSGPDGSIPLGVVLDAAGAVYGMTSLGGTQNQGTLFKLKPPAAGTAGPYTPSNRSFPVGAAPNQGSVFVDGAGVIYAAFYSTFLMLAPDASGNVYTLRGGVPPQTPNSYTGGPVVDASGAIYATTKAEYPGNGGTLVKFTPPAPGSNDYTSQVLQTFGGGPEGGIPAGDLFIDRNGVVYGTTRTGGSTNANCPSGCGVVWALTP